VEIGIIGLPKCGKTTVFGALSSGGTSLGNTNLNTNKPNLGIAKVQDSRLNILVKMFNPAKTTPAEVKYIDFPKSQEINIKSKGISGEYLNSLQNADALLQVVRSFDNPAVPHIEGSVDPHRDVSLMDLELSFSDLTILERRLEKLTNELKSTKANEREVKLKEQSTLSSIKNGLEQEIPIREQVISEEEQKILSNFQFLTAKPMLIVWNIGENNLGESQIIEDKLTSEFTRPKVGVVVVSGKIEQELGNMEGNDSEEFRKFMGIQEPALNKAIRSSYELLGLISFFTVGSDEVKAWTIERNIEASKAAGKIHTDIERGFIRAEVISFQNLLDSGSLGDGKKKGLLKLEGKSYVVTDGDIINFLFNI
jgi:GTP-binding protein YchF